MNFLIANNLFLPVLSGEFELISWAPLYTVNELSNTIDLPSTLLRAQSLFRRFQRTVDAIDKKHNFPAPNIRQRKPTVDPSSAAAGSGSKPRSPPAATGADVRNGVVGKAKAKAKAKEGAADSEGEKERVISPELRGLLSRTVVVLDKEGNVGRGVGKNRT